MTTEIVASNERMAVADVVQHARTVQQVMQAVMKEGLHYGKIPGTDKPTLLQPGADVLAMTFRIAQKLDITDLSTTDVVRYRVTCSGVHQGTGTVLGEGIGECSSGEEKYKWRRAVSNAEFNATPDNMRRVKFGKNYTTEQVRTDPADMANTVLKMAVKRAKIAMILNVTGASDMFGQDLEDLDEALRESMTEAPVSTRGPLTAEELSAWEAAAKRGKRAAKEFFRSMAPEAQRAATDAQKAAYWAMAVAADEAKDAKPTEEPKPDPFVAEMDAATTGAA